MALQKVEYKNNQTVITAENMNDIQDSIIELENAPGISGTARTLLATILQNAVYTSDQSENIDALISDFASALAVKFAVSLSLENVTVGNNQREVAQGAPYVATITAIDKYNIETVTVKMGGIDITATAYDGNGNIKISAVTGDIVITALAVYDPGMVWDIRLATNTGSANGVYYIQAIDVLNTRAALIPIAQYLKKGKTYKCSLGGASALGYSYGVVVHVAPEAGMTFEIPNNTKTTYPNITSQIVDSGWINTDYEYTPTVDNCIIGVNFKNSSNGVMTEADRENLLANFTLKEVR